MATIPLFIQTPCSPSVKRALSVLDATGNFNVHMVPFDQDILKLVVAARPCAAIFSVTDATTSSHTFELFEQLKALHSGQAKKTGRDPRLRTLLVGEGWNVPIERWQDAGVHEYIPGPISIKSLGFKLSRHYLKATSAEEDEPDDEFTNTPDQEVILVPGRGIGKKIDERVYRIKGTSAEEEVRSRPGPAYVTIRATGALLQDDKSNWVPGKPTARSKDTWTYAPDSTGLEGKPKLTFIGDKPQYDKASQTWVFRGDEPSLKIETAGKVPVMVIGVSENGENIVALPHSGFDVVEVTRQVYYLGRDLESSPETRISADRQKLGSPDVNLGPDQKSDSVEAVVAITDFLDSWKPKTIATPTSGSPTSTPGETKTTTAPIESSEINQHLKPVEEIEAFYSGPGMREAYVPDIESHLKDSPSYKTEMPALNRKESPAAGETKPEKPASKVSGPQTGAAGAPIRNGLSDEKTPAAAKKLEIPSSTPKAADGKSPVLRETGAERKPARGLSQDPTPPSGDAIQKQGAVDEGELRSSTSPPNSSAPAIPIANDPSRDSLLLSGNPERKRKQGDLDTSHLGNSGTKSNTTDLSVSNKTSEALGLTVSGGKTEAEQEHRFKADAPEGAQTWSMQSEGDDLRSTGRKTKGAAAQPDAAAQGHEDREGRLSAQKADGGANPEAGSGANADQDAQAKTDSDSELNNNSDKTPPEKPWLERTRKILKKIFDTDD